MILPRIVLVGMLTVLPAAAAECVISVRMDEDPPYLTVLPDGQPGGVNADVTREALRRIGCQVDFRTLPFSRAMKDLETGKLDMVPNLFRTPAREVYALYSRTRDQVPNRLFIRAADKGKWDLHDFQDLPRLGVRLGVPAGAMVSPDFATISAEPAFKAILTSARNHDSLWRMLSGGHVDAVIADEQTAHWELTHLGFAGTIAPTGFVAAAAPAYFAFSKASVSADQVAAFDAAIDEMRKDGSLAAILTRYGLDPDAAIDISE